MSRILIESDGWAPDVFDDAVGIEKAVAKYAEGNPSLMNGKPITVSVIDSERRTFRVTAKPVVREDGV